MVRELIQNRNTPAWLSCIAALVVGCVAVWSFAASPSEKVLDDHEERIRVIELTTTQQLATINANIQALTREVRANRGHQPRRE